MTRSRRQAIGGTDAATLLAGAVDGNPESFDGLFRRYAPEAWTFASGVSGADDTARHAVTDGFAASVVTARDGSINHPGAFRRTLMQATRRRVAERDDPTAPGHGESTCELAAPFAALPELHRSVLWLQHVHHLRPNRIAEVVEVAPTEVEALTRRAHHGLAVHHLGAIASTADPTCARVLRDSARSLARRLSVTDRVAVRSHVSSCATCALALAPVNDLDSRLPRLASPFPEALIDDAREAWVRATTPPTSTGLSPLIERVLAATSAAAAVVAIVGAAYWRGDPSTETVAIAPVLNSVGAPVPSVGGLDIDRPLEIPGVTDGTGVTTSPRVGDVAPEATARGLSDSEPTISPEVGEPVEDAGTDPTPDTAPGEGTAPTDDDAGTTENAPTGPDPLLTVSLPLGPQTVSINLGGGELIETGATADATAGTSGTLVDDLTSAVTKLLGG